MSSGDDAVDPSWPADEHSRQPTVEQERFASGFEEALNNLHQSRGTPRRPSYYGVLASATQSQAPYGITSTSPGVIVRPPTNLIQPSALVSRAVQQRPSNSGQNQSVPVRSSNRSAPPYHVPIKLPPTSAAIGQQPTTAAINGVSQLTTAVSGNVLDDRERQRMMKPGPSHLDRSSYCPDKLLNLVDDRWINEPVAGPSGLSSVTCAQLPLVIESANDALAGPSGTQPQQLGDTDNAESATEIDPKRARNRSAATKCRLKKIAHTNEMKRRLTETGAENEKIKAETVKLKARLSAMETLLQAHLSSGLCKLRHGQPKED